MVTRVRSRAVQDKGFTYLMLLWWVAIGSVMLAALGQQWALERQRQREIEMVFRAQDIQAALLSYHVPAVPGQPAVWPKRLDDLLEDRRGPVIKRHLRRVWVDPLNPKGNWGLIKDGDAPDAGIKGVYSLAKGVPLRAPGGILRYDAWRFDASSVTNGP